MDRTFISDLSTISEELVLLRGWIHKINSLGKVCFVTLRDKTGLVQIVIEDCVPESLRSETSVEVVGKRVLNSKAPGGIEIQQASFKILGSTHYDMLPIEVNGYKIKSSLETQLDNRTLSLRIPKTRAVFKIQEEITEAFRTFLRDRKFTEIHTPKIINSSTEGGSEMFTVNYFERRAFLAQSPQFYKQMMVGAGFERVYEVAPAYRAELHNTWRHLNEYISLDVEMGFIEDEFELMTLEEDFMSYLFNHLNRYCKKELALFDVALPDEVNIPRIPLSEAHDILLNEYGKKSPVGNIDAEGEVLFSKYVKEKYDSDFVFLTKYPIPKRPMYAMPDDDMPGMTKSFDLIYKGLEITTGGQRIHDYKMLIENIKKFGLNPDDFDFYADSFKYGMPPHGGFAIGLERLTMKILNLQNIREATLLPRDMKRLTP